MEINYLVNLIFQDLLLNFKITKKSKLTKNGTRRRIWRLQTRTTLHFKILMPTMCCMDASWWLWWPSCSCLFDGMLVHNVLLAPKKNAYGPLIGRLSHDVIFLYGSVYYMNSYQLVILIFNLITFNQPPRKKISKDLPSFFTFSWLRSETQFDKLMKNVKIVKIKKTIKKLNYF